jgi:hypothetical protein
MGENKPRENECELVMNLFHYSGRQISYDATSGLSRRLTLSGQIDDAWYDDYYYKIHQHFTKSLCALNSILRQTQRRLGGKENFL